MYWRKTFVRNIYLLCKFIEIELRHGCSPVNLRHIFRIPFPRNASGRLLLNNNVKKRDWEKGQYINDSNNSRSSHRRCSVKKGVLKDFAKVTGKYPCWSVFFNNKVSRLRPATLLKKGLQHRCFPVNFTIFLRTPFL